MIPGHLHDPPRFGEAAHFSLTAAAACEGGSGDPPLPAGHSQRREVLQIPRVSRSQFYVYLQRHREGGAAALEDEKRGPKRSPLSTIEELVLQIRRGRQYGAVRLSMYLSATTASACRPRRFFASFGRTVSIRPVMTAICVLTVQRWGLSVQRLDSTRRLHWVRLSRGCSAKLVTC